MVILGQRMLSLTESKLLNALSVDGLEISLNLCFHNLSNKQTAAGELMKGYSFILLNLIFSLTHPLSMPRLRAAVMMGWLASYAAP